MEEHNKILKQNLDSCNQNLDNCNANFTHLNNTNNYILPE